MLMKKKCSSGYALFPLSLVFSCILPWIVLATKKKKLKIMTHQVIMSNEKYGLAFVSIHSMKLSNAQVNFVAGIVLASQNKGKYLVVEMFNDMKDGSFLAIPFSQLVYSKIENLRIK